MTLIAEVKQAVQIIAWKKANVWKNKVIWKVLIPKNKISNEPDYKIAVVTPNGRLKGFFASENVVNLSNSKNNKAEVSLLSKGLKFCPTINMVDTSVLKEDQEKFGRTLTLKWHYKNDERTFDPNPFRPKSKFNPKKTDATIELYLIHI